MTFKFFNILISILCLVISSVLCFTTDTSGSVGIFCISGWSCVVLKDLTEIIKEKNDRS